MKEGLYYEKIDDKIKCLLCPQACIISEGKKGSCQVRQNVKGKLYSLNYGQATSISMDPIEKKPLYQFYPGSSILSIGSAGCNLHCSFCQNWTISQEVENALRQSEEISPQQAIELAKKNNSFAISYTYNEPLISYEFVLETAKLAHDNNFKNVLVTNGFINQEPLREILPFIDGANIDLKSFNNDFYVRISRGKLAPVLESIETMQDKIHIEITNLIIPGLNDKEEEIKAMADWISSLDRDIPLHFSGYFPCYKLDLPPTPHATLKKARDIAGKKLNYVYIGNVFDAEANNTYCPQCKKVIIARSGYTLIDYKIKEGKCHYCGAKINIKE